MSIARQYQDAETGLIYLRARYYDPATAQFLSRDPVTSITQAPYSYTDDNPLNAQDPSGLCSVNPFSNKSCLNSAAHAVNNAVNTVTYGTLEFASSVAYQPYYWSYEALKTINGLPAPLRYGVDALTIVTGIRPGLDALEAAGLGADVGIDWLKNKVLHNGESCADEGINGPILGNFAKKHGIDIGNAYLPGVHHNGSIDFQW